MGNVSHSSTFQTVTDQTVSPPERTTFLSCSPFFFLHKSKLLLLLNIMQTRFFFIMDFFFFGWSWSATGKKKYETRKQKKNKTPKKNLPKPRKAPESVCKEGGRGGEEEKLVTEWERLTWTVPPRNSWERKRSTLPLCSFHWNITHIRVPELSDSLNW